jgi:hypothetical protein
MVSEDKINTDWAGIFHHVYLNLNVTLAIKWCSFWLPEDIKEKLLDPNSWLFLFIYIEAVEQVITANIKDDGFDKEIYSMEIDTVDGKNRLRISDVFGGQVSVVYTRDVSFLAIDRNEKVILI